MTNRTEPPKATGKRDNWVQDAISQMDETYFTVSQVAEMTGISVQTLRKWYRRPDYGMQAPSKQLTHGKTVVYLYTPEDVEEVIAFRNGVKKNV